MNKKTKMHSSRMRTARMSRGGRACVAWGRAWSGGACVAGGHAWQEGHVWQGGHAWQGACMGGSFHGRGRACQGGMYSRGHVWQECPPATHTPSPVDRQTPVKTTFANFVCGRYKVHWYFIVLFRRTIRKQRDAGPTSSIVCMNTKTKLCKSSLFYLCTLFGIYT